MTLAEERCTNRRCLRIKLGKRKLQLNFVKIKLNNFYNNRFININYTNIHCYNNNIIIIIILFIINNINYNNFKQQLYLI